MNNNNEALNDLPKRTRGRPKGSKNKPKNEIEVQVEQKLRSNSEKKVPVKVAKKAIKKQSDTIFIIKPKAGGKCYYQTEITVDYTPCNEHETDRVSIVPKLNVDSKPHIPGFIMDMDKGYYEKHDQRYKDDHDAKILDYTKPKSRLYQPKPGKRHNYCCVCKQSYDDYLEHVSSSNHKKSYNHNEFSELIRKISKDYDSNHRNNVKHQEPTEILTDTQTPQEDDIDCLLLTDSATQKFGNKCNEKPNKGSPNQYNNLIYSSQMLKKNSSQMTTHDQIKSNFLQKSVSMNLKGGQSGTTNYHEGYLAFQQNTLGLNNKQTSSTNFQQPLYALAYNQQYYLNIPQISSNDNEIMVPEMIQNLSNNNSHNNSLNNNNNQINNLRQIKNSYIKQSIVQNSNGNTIVSNSNLNMKRKAENYPLYNDNLESTRKNQFQNPITDKQIIDLTEEGNNSQKPKTIITTQNTSQARIPSNGNYILYPPSQFVVCND